MGLVGFGSEKADSTISSQSDLRLFEEGRPNKKKNNDTKNNYNKISSNEISS